MIPRGEVPVNDESKGHVSDCIDVREMRNGEWSGCQAIHLFG